MTVNALWIHKKTYFTTWTFSPMYMSWTVKKAEHQKIDLESNQKGN